jgi:hypothetical protein
MVESENTWVPDALTVEDQALRRMARQPGLRRPQQMTLLT